ncbi:MAG: N-acetyl-alpha-D-glucosaminyl L-malate synthase BshA [Caryophanon sp.]|nr:N-acetyl-alpha-D-glucosaminyl L-malate synthase BshA [Caryophanon sp.]
MTKLKIGITCYPTVGGSGVLATELGKLLAERGHEIHFITSSMPFRLNRMYPNIFFHEVDVNQYSVFQYPPYDIALASKIAEVVKEQKLNVMHVHYAIPHAVCAALARSMSDVDFGIVTTLHGTDITVLGQDASMIQPIKYGIEASDIVTAVSSALKEQTYELIDTKKSIETVYNFVDERVYAPQQVDHLKKHFGIADDEKVLIHVSNFRKIKNVDHIVETFFRVRSEMRTKLLLVGDGPEMNRITQLVKDSPYKDDVLFLGRQENVAELYSISDVMLLMSSKESFGLVLLEAMACGVPGIGTNVGGIPEVIEHGKTGYIVEEGDIDGAAAQIVQLLQDAPTLAQFKEASKEAVQLRFSSSSIVAQYEALYEKVAKFHE